jgi:hypothetical protein
VGRHGRGIAKEPNSGNRSGKAEQESHIDGPSQCSQLNPK